MARASLVITVLAAALALAFVSAEAHTPTITKGSFKKSAFTYREGAGVVLNEGTDPGSRLLIDSTMAADGHGHFVRYFLCTAVRTDEVKGVAYSCSSEVDFVTGTLVSQVSSRGETNACLHCGCATVLNFFPRRRPNKKIHKKTRARSTCSTASSAGRWS